MAKKCIIQREKKRFKMSSVFAEKRDKIRSLRNNKTISIEDRLSAQAALDFMPRDSSFIRRRNRCFITGRSRGYYRYFGVSRIMLRELVSFGRLPGVVKSSW